MRVIASSIKHFIKLETSSSIILFVVSILAIIWANSTYSSFYQDLWNHEFAVGFANTKFHLSKPLILWINDGLMAIFFFVIGLEVKREILVGELTTLRKASLPIFATIGGMFFPVLMFLLWNSGKSGSEGWGIPMATDIAFTLGILKILGKRIPLGLKIFITAFAIVDDIGAVIVIALFYSANIQWDLIGYALLIFSFIAVLSYRKIYSKYLYFIVGFLVWVLFLKSGIHPTIAGILMAFTIPIHTKVDVKEYFRKITKQLTVFNENKSNTQLLTTAQIHAIDRMESINEQVHSPLQHLEHTLHGWVSYIIMPIFAFANAGVVLSFSDLGNAGHLTLSIGVSMVVGNAIGILLMSFIALKLKIADLPNGVNLKQLIGISLLGGLGFTMSLFIVNLAYTDAEFIAASKLGVIIGSLIAGLLGFLVLRFTSKKLS